METRWPQPRELLQVGAAMLLLVLMHFWRVLFLGESYCATIDMYNQHYPIALGAVRALLAGDFPLWCPWRAAGTPWFASTTPNLLDPLGLLVLLFPNDLGVNLQFMAQTFAAGLAYYASLRYWGIRHRAAFLVSVVIVWTGIFLDTMPWKVFTGGHWILPLALTAYDAALRGPGAVKKGIIAGVLFGCVVFATQPQIWTYAALFAVAYGAAWWSLAPTRGALRRGTLVTALVVLVWFAFSAVQVLPFVEVFRYSNRVAPVPGAQKYQQADLATQDLPLTLSERAARLWDDVNDARRAFAWDGRFWLMRGFRALRAFPGVAPGLALLALWGFFHCPRDTIARFSLWMVAFTAVGFLTVVAETLVRVIAAVQVDRLYMFLPWFLAYPAARGIEAFDAEAPAARPLRRLIVLLVAGGIALTWAPALAQTIPSLRPLGLFETFAPSYGVRVAAEAGFFGAVCVLVARRPRGTHAWSRGLLPMCASALAVAHALFSGPPSVTHSPLDARQPIWTALMAPVTPARLGVLVMQRDPRYYGADIEDNLYQMPLHPNHAVLYEPPFCVTGDYNNVLVQRYVEYMDMLNLGERSRGWLNMAGLANPSRPLVDLLGVRYLASKLDVRSAPGGARYRLIHYEAEHDYRGNEDVHARWPLYVFENTHRLPRAFFLSRGVAVPDRDTRLSLLAEDAFEPRAAVILDSDRGVEGRVLPNLPAAPDPLFTPAAIDRYGMNEVRVRVEAPADGFLVLTDVVFPGWRASVDGRPTGIVPAYHTFRAVPVPAGPHEIVFTYRPRSFIVGATLTALALIAGAGVCGMGALQQRRGVRMSGRSADG